MIYELEESEYGVHPAPDDLNYEKDTDGVFITLKDLEKTLQYRFL